MSLISAALAYSFFEVRNLIPTMTHRMPRICRTRSYHVALSISLRIIEPEKFQPISTHPWYNGIISIC